MKITLIYVHDPMCSWCWGFEPVRQQLFSALDPAVVQVRRLVGGLAPDSNEPMPLAMQSFLQDTWRKIENTIPGTKFNFDFWTKCQPRRSTYPANRAVIAARLQHPKFDLAMTTRIQQAYYQEAKNPSDESVLIELAEEIGLNVVQFETELKSAMVNSLLVEEIAVTRSLGLNSFPGMALMQGEKLSPISIAYNDFEIMRSQIDQIIAADGSN